MCTCSKGGICLVLALSLGSGTHLCSLFHKERDVFPAKHGSAKMRKEFVFTLISLRIRNKVFTSNYTLQYLNMMETNCFLAQSRKHSPDSLFVLFLMRQ